MPEMLMPNKYLSVWIGLVMPAISPMDARLLSVVLKRAGEASHIFYGYQISP